MTWVSASHFKAKLAGRTGLVLIGLGQLIAYAGLAWTARTAGSLREPVIGQTVVWYLLATFSFLLALHWAEKQRHFPVRWLWGGAILFRLLLLTTTPTLSDDVYRYLWDGHLVTAGISPYQYRIDAPELDELAIPARTLANNRWMASPYLPAAHWLFAAIVWLLPAKPFSAQLILILIDLGVALIFGQLLRVWGQPPHRLLWYLWHPLLIIEIAHGAHLDIWMTGLALLALLIAFRPVSPQPARLLSPLFLALATLTKILPLFLLPVLFWRWRWRERLLYGAVVAGVLWLAAQPAGWGLSGPLDGTGLFGALRIYAAQWQFNGGLFALLAATLGETVARQLGLVMPVALAGFVWWWSRKQPLTGQLSLLPVPLLGYLICSATVAPWYLILLVPFAATPQAALPDRLLRAALLYLSLTVFLSYLIYAGPAGSQLYAIVRLGEWVPTLLLALLSLATALRQP